MVGMLTLTVVGVFQNPGGGDRPRAPLHAAEQLDKRDPGRPSTWPTSAAQLFSRYLMAVEVAGTLLLVALVGAVAIVAQGRRREARPLAAQEGRRHG